MAEPDAGWTAVLDDLEHRVEAAEGGDLAALDGWEPPAIQPRPMSDEDRQRATGILSRQQALQSRLRADQQALAVTMRAMRRPQYKAAAPVPVYLDRLG